MGKKFRTITVSREVKAKDISIVIRKARKEDVQTILALINQLAEYEQLSQEVRATPELLQRYGFGTEVYYHCLLAETRAEDGGTAVGFALYFFTFSTFLGKPTLYLEDLFVLPRYRGRGVGTALLKSLARIALEKDCGRMEWAVLDWNTPAIEFYKSIGAIALSDWTTYRMPRETLLRFVNPQQEDNR